MTDALQNHEGSVSIGGRTITNLRFAYDIDALNRKIVMMTKMMMRRIGMVRKMVMNRRIGTRKEKMVMTIGEGGNK